MTENNFDVESFRKKHESSADWKVKRAFLLSNHEYFENQVLLLTMANCYVNVHCYGCKYPDDVMSRLNELEQNIDKSLIDSKEPEIKNEKKNKKKKRKTEPVETDKQLSNNDEFEQIVKKMLKFKQNLPENMNNKTEFLNQFKAALDKTKSSSTTSYEALSDGKFRCDLYIDTVLVSNAIASNKKTAKFSAHEKAFELLNNGKLKVQRRNSSSEGKPDELELVGIEFPFDGNLRTHIVENNCIEKNMVVMSDKRFKKLFKNFVLYLSKYNRNDNSFLGKSMAMNKASFTRFREKDVIYFYLNEELVSIGKGENYCASATQNLINRFKMICPTLVMDKIYEVDDEFEVHKEDLLKEGVDVINSYTIPDSNIGNKLLRKMGWSGGGVGKEGNKGITEPISLTESIQRLGLGTPHRSFSDKVRKLIEHYIATKNDKDLVFKGNFSKEERKIMHFLSGKQSLLSKWYGPQGELVMVISRKRDIQSLMEHVQNHENCKFSIAQPSSFINDRSIE